MPKIDRLEEAIKRLEKAIKRFEKVAERLERATDNSSKSLAKKSYVKTDCHRTYGMED